MLRLGCVFSIAIKNFGIWQGSATGLAVLVVVLNFVFTVVRVSSSLREFCVAQGNRRAQRESLLKLSLPKMPNTI